MFLWDVAFLFFTAQPTVMPSSKGFKHVLCIMDEYNASQGVNIFLFKMFSTLSIQCVHVTCNN